METTFAFYNGDDDRREHFATKEEAIKRLHEFDDRMTRFVDDIRALEANPRIAARHHVTEHDIESEAVELCVDEEDEDGYISDEPLEDGTMWSYRVRGDASLYSSARRIYDALAEIYSEDEEDEDEV